MIQMHMELRERFVAQRRSPFGVQVAQNRVGRGDGPLPFGGESHDSRAAVGRVGSPLDETKAFEVLDELRHGLLRHLRALCQLADAAPRPEIFEDLGVSGADLGKAGVMQPRGNVLIHLVIQGVDKDAKWREFGSTGVRG